jgi:RNA-dependent RNA polymerase
MVSVDENLEGIKMRLRPSMCKFEVHDDDNADIEIARAFERPNLSFLNRQVESSHVNNAVHLTISHRSLVMILEDRGVRLDALLALQESAVADARRIDDSIDEFCRVLKAHTLGSGYRLAHTLERISKLGLDLKSDDESKAADTLFLNRVRNFAKNHVLRDMKHSARIPVPNSWLLVGVADEGPAYVNKGYQNVFCLQAGKIYGTALYPIFSLHTDSFIHIKP